MVNMMPLCIQAMEVDHSYDLKNTSLFVSTRIFQIIGPDYFWCH